MIHLAGLQRPIFVVHNTCTVATTEPVSVVARTPHEGVESATATDIVGATAAEYGVMTAAAGQHVSTVATKDGEAEILLIDHDGRIDHAHNARTMALGERDAGGCRSQL